MLQHTDYGGARSCRYRSEEEASAESSRTLATSAGWLRVPKDRNAGHCVIVSIRKTFIV